MPKRNDVQNILVIGSGPIIIGQACEFDYSGTQACMAIKEENFCTVLINSNPASIMTDPNVADVTYIEPITLEVVKMIIIKEKIDAVLTTVGGQLALNLACELDKDDDLVKMGVKLIGAERKVIERAENRKNFQELLKEIDLETPKGYEISSLEEAHNTLQFLTFPLIIRSSFTLGGKGAVIVNSLMEFENAVRTGLNLSPINRILIEESIIGWKEFEMEVIRDKKDNCIIVCSIENIDPMGVHTGDSIAVAPALTLTDKEFQTMRDQAFSVIRAVGVETGGANVQFAVNPKDGRMVVIEMNPRVSRSSALASKATGYPIARIAAKLAIGYTLDELSIDLTGNGISAAFEPSIDYVVTKIPRFDFEKFPDVKDRLGISMQSIGESMALGRSFKESFQKAIRSLEKGYEGLGFPSSFLCGLDSHLLEQIAIPSSDRFFLIAEAYRRGIATEEIHKLSGWDPWFLEEIKSIINIENQLQVERLPKTYDDWAYVKSMGFSDSRIAHLTKSTVKDVMDLRYQHNIRPSCFKVDSCAGQFEVQTNYLYLTYQRYPGFENEANISHTMQRKVMILGSGPNCISQGIEFDYCCVHAAKAIKEHGYQAIMINCNPETVSTDHTVSDKLYFSSVTEEEIREIIRLESEYGYFEGIMIQFGGQTAIKCAQFLADTGLPPIGTDYHAVNLTEDRDKFRQVLDQLHINQPMNLVANDRATLLKCIDEICFPIILRPSYVIGGKGMEIISNLDDLEKSRVYRHFDLFKPILVEEFLDEAIEIEVDALCDCQDICIVGMIEHFEKAGIHSGDSHFSLPTFSLSQSQIESVMDISAKLAKHLKVKGLINIQFAIKGENIYVLEVNLRAGRTIPFLSKATQVPISQIATKIALGFSIQQLNLPKMLEINNVYFKQPIFSFNALPNAKCTLGPEMKSTGEQMHIGKTFEEALKKLILSKKTKKRNGVFIYGVSECSPIIEALSHCFSNQDVTVYIDYEEAEERMTNKCLNNVFLVLDLSEKHFRNRFHSSIDIHAMTIIDNIFIINVMSCLKTKMEQVDYKNLNEWNMLSNRQLLDSNV